MASADDTQEPNRTTLAELSALADGTLDPERAAAVRQLIARSPELSERYERERRAVMALHAVRSDRAPARLRARVQGQTAAASARPGPRLAWGGAAATAVAAVVAALVLLLPGGAPGAPSVSQAASLALRGPALGPPLPDRVHPGSNLARDVQEIYFPNWSGWFGWKASGQRTDHLGKSLAVTVYYNHAGRRIAYTILSSPPLRWPGTRMVWLHGTAFQRFTLNGRQVVTWRRAGHTCVLSGAGVKTAELVRLASWKAPGRSG
jgi:hypothetical protein